MRNSVASAALVVGSHLGARVLLLEANRDVGVEIREAHLKPVGRAGRHGELAAWGTARKQSQQATSAKCGIKTAMRARASLGVFGRRAPSGGRSGNVSSRRMAQGSCRSSWRTRARSTCFRPLAGRVHRAMFVVRPCHKCKCSRIRRRICGNGGALRACAASRIRPRKLGSSSGPCPQPSKLSSYQLQKACGVQR